MNGTRTARVAVLWRGDREARRTATPQNNRFHRVFEELAALGIHAEPAVYAEDMADEVREQLLTVDGVLVWVDPIHRGRGPRGRSTRCCAMSRRSGPWVSAHPDVILKMGVKEVLHRTKHLGWGTDTHLYRTAEAFREEFPRAAAIGRPARAEAESRQWRPGRVEGRARRPRPGERAMVRVLHARRGSVPEEMALGGFHDALRGVFRAPTAASSISRSSRGCRTA